MTPADILKCARLLCRPPSDPSQTGVRPHVAADSEVYKMLQENQESDEPPRQSASFKVLQEILETGTDPGYDSQLPISFLFTVLLMKSKCVKIVYLCVCL